MIYESSADPDHVSAALHDAADSMGLHEGQITKLKNGYDVPLVLAEHVGFEIPVSED